MTIGIHHWDEKVAAQVITSTDHRGGGSGTNRNRGIENTSHQMATDFFGTGNARISDIRLIVDIVQSETRATLTFY